MCLSPIGMWARIGGRPRCGVTHKTVKKIIEAHEAGEPPQPRARGRNFDPVRWWLSGWPGRRPRLL
jgi:hypothetical protein